MPYSTPDRGLSKDLWPEISLRPLRSPTDSLRKIWGGISSSETSLEAPWEVPSGKLLFDQLGVFGEKKDAPLERHPVRTLVDAAFSEQRYHS